MDIDVDDPNWRLIFSLISERQLMTLQKRANLDKQRQAVTRGAGATFATRPSDQPCLSGSVER